MARKNWIKSAIKHPGALTRAAKRAHAVGKGGKIKSSWLNKTAAKGGVMGRRASLARTLRRMHR